MHRPRLEADLQEGFSDSDKRNSAVARARDEEHCGRGRLQEPLAQRRPKAEGRAVSEERRAERLSTAVVVVIYRT